MTYKRLLSDTSSFIRMLKMKIIPVRSPIYMYLRTVIPKPIPRKVAMATPKTPTRIPGTTKEPHPLAVAIPQAVVGPPMLALDAKSNSFKSR